jgi:hypothetical protein
VSAAVALLTRLSALGVAAKADDGALRLRPASAIPTDLLAELREHKADVLALLEAEVSVALPALFPPVPPPIDEFRARLTLAAADPTRAGDYLHGEASVVPPAAAPPVEDSPEPTSVADNLVERLAAIFARSAPWQRVIDQQTAMAYLQARARATLAPLDPLARERLIAAEEARAGEQPKPPSRWLAQSPPNGSLSDRGSIVLGAVAARTAVLLVACTQCSRSGRYRAATLIEQHGAGCTIPELRHVLTSDCQKRGNVHGGCDVWFPELPALFRGDDSKGRQMNAGTRFQDHDPPSSLHLS